MTVGELAHDIGAVLGAPDADGDIDTSFEQIDEPVAEVQFDFEKGMGVRELGERGGNKQTAKRDRRTDSQDTERFLSPLLQPLFRRLKGLEHPIEMGLQDNTLSGWREPTCGPMNEALASAALKSGEALADDCERTGVLRDVEFGSYAGVPRTVA